MSFIKGSTLALGNIVLKSLSFNLEFPYFNRTYIVTIEIGLRLDWRCYSRDVGLLHFSSVGQGCGLPLVIAGLQGCGLPLVVAGLQGCGLPLVITGLQGCGLLVIAGLQVCGLPLVIAGLNKCIESRKPNYSTIAHRILDLNSRFLEVG